MKRGSNRLIQSTLDRSVLTVPKKLVTKARQWFNQLTQSTPVQSVPMVPKKLAMKAKQLFNLLIQTILANWKLRVHKNPVMKVKPLFNLQIQSTQANWKPRVHKNQVTKVRRLSNPRILSTLQLLEVSQRLKRKPSIILSKLSLMIASMWMKRLSSKKVKKVAKKSRKFTKPLMVSRLVSQLLYQVRLLRCHNLESFVVAANL